MGIGQCHVIKRMTDVKFMLHNILEMINVLCEVWTRMQHNIGLCSSYTSITNSNCIILSFPKQIPSHHEVFPYWEKPSWYQQYATLGLDAILIHPVPLNMGNIPCWSSKRMGPPLGSVVMWAIPHNIPTFSPLVPYDHRQLSTFTWLVIISFT